MGVHKLSAGDGYGYLTRQVAVHDSTELGRTGLAGYYSEKGESPGRWLGAGLAGLDMVAGETVTEEQMQALFGAGRHPNAAALQAAVIAAGGGAAAAEAAGALGRPFNVYPEQVSSLRVEVARQFGVYNTERGWLPLPRSRRRSGPGSAPRSRPGCSPSGTAGTRPIRGSCAGSSRRSRGRRRRRWPATT